MKKWKRILSAVLAVLLLSGSMPVWAAETVDPDEQARDIQELKDKRRTDPRRRAWKVYEKGTNRRGTCRRGNAGSEQLFCGSGLPGNDPAGNTPCLWILEYNGI